MELTREVKIIAGVLVIVVVVTAGYFSRNRKRGPRESTPTQALTQVKSVEKGLLREVGKIIGVEEEQRDLGSMGSDEEIIRYLKDLYNETPISLDGEEGVLTLEEGVLEEKGKTIHLVFEPKELEKEEEITILYTNELERAKESTTRELIEESLMSLVTQSYERQNPEKQVGSISNPKTGKGFVGLFEKEGEGYLTDYKVSIENGTIMIKAVKGGETDK